jgi:hypothetical protein
MLTRGMVAPAYATGPVPRVARTGIVRVTVAKNITHTWAIARPSSYPLPNGAPFYVNDDPHNSVLRGGALPLFLGPEHVEMDPSNDKTWQRKYTFSA